MKKLVLSLLMLFVPNIILAGEGAYTTSTVCNYKKSTINSNSKTIASLVFDCVSTVIKTDNSLFPLYSKSYAESVGSMIKSSEGIELRVYNTAISAANADDKIFSELIRNVGDINQGGKGKSKIVGGSGKFQGITGNCEYTVVYHPEKKASQIADCKYNK